jgi:hypothetical protein
MKFRLCSSPSGYSGYIHWRGAKLHIFFPPEKIRKHLLERPFEARTTFTHASTTKDKVRRYYLQIRRLFALLQYACLVSAKAYLQRLRSLQAEAERPVSTT